MIRILMVIFILSYTQNVFAADSLFSFISNVFQGKNNVKEGDKKVKSYAKQKKIRAAKNKNKKQQQQTKSKSKAFFTSMKKNKDLFVGKVKKGYRNLKTLSKQMKEQDSYHSYSLLQRNVSYEGAQVNIGNTDFEANNINSKDLIGVSAGLEKYLYDDISFFTKASFFRGSTDMIDTGVSWQRGDDVGNVVVSNDLQILEIFLGGKKYYPLKKTKIAKNFFNNSKFYLGGGFGYTQFSSKNKYYDNEGEVDSSKATAKSYFTSALLGYELLFKEKKISVGAEYTYYNDLSGVDSSLNLLINYSILFKK